MASNKRLNAIISIGGTVASSLGSAIGGTRRRMSELGGTIRQTEKQQRLLADAIQTMGRQGKNVDALRRKHQAVTEELKRQRQEMAKLHQAHQGMAQGRAQMGSAGVALGITAAVGATVAAPVVEAAKFERAMLGVAKQVEGARDPAGNLTAVYYDMERQIQALGREIPMATADLAGMVTAGARMGVAREHLLDFTRTAAMMASAFDGMQPEELADNMGKIAGLFGIPIPAVGELADAINYLDDNAQSKGADIIEVMQRIGGTAATLKMGAKDAAALGSTFLTLGASAEVAATASNAVMRELAIATMQPKRFQEGLRAIGMDAKKVQADMAKDATGTILTVLDALKKVPEAKQLEVTTQLFGKEYGDDVAKLAMRVDEYRRQIKLANGEEAKGSMSREFQAARALTTSQWEMAKNTVSELAVNFGSILLPAVNSVLGAVGSTVGAVASWVRENRELVGNVTAVGGTLLALTAGTKVAALGVGAVTFAFNALKIALATNPLGLAITLLATAAVMVYKNWEPIRGFFVSLWGDITGTAERALGWIIGKIEAVGAGWQRVKQFFGAGGEPGAGQAPPVRGPAPPPLPAMATARGGAGSVQNTQQNVFHITQLPGEDAEALARRTAQLMAQQQAVRQRGAMYDQPGMAF